MPQVKTTAMVGGGNISAGRLTINSNFELLQGVINDIQTYLNIDNKAMTGIQSLTLFKGSETTPTPNDYLFRTNGSVSILGSAVIGGLTTSNTARFATGLELTSGDFNLLSSNTTINLNGNLNLGGELVLNDLALDGYVPAYSLLYFQNSGSSDTSLVLYDGSTAIGGKISLKNRNSIILDWSGYEGSSTTTALNYIQLMTGAQSGNTTLKTGQVVDIIALVVDGYEFFIDGSTLKHPSGALGTPTSIKFTDSYQSIRVIYNGTDWVVLNVEGAEIVV